MRVRFGAGEGDHGEAVGVGSVGAGGLEGLAGGGGEEDLGEAEGVGRGAGDGEVAAVWGVERSTEERDAGFTAEGDAGCGLGWCHGGGVVPPPPPPEGYFGEKTARIRDLQGRVGCKILIPRNLCTKYLES